MATAHLGGVACYTTPLPPPKVLACDRGQIDTIGEAMPIDESYYGEMFITIPNFTKDIMTYERGDFVAAMCSRLNPVAINIQENTFCRIPGRPPITFGKSAASGIRTFTNSAFSFTVDHNVKVASLKQFDQVIPRCKTINAICCTYTDGDIAFAVRYPQLEVCADSEAFRHRTPWTSVPHTL